VLDEISFTPPTATAKRSGQTTSGGGGLDTARFTFHIRGSANSHDAASSAAKVLYAIKGLPLVSCPPHKRTYRFPMPGTCKECQIWT
jgi:hypothetical protein